MIEELEDIIEDIANKIGSYGGERSVFTSTLETRIRSAIAIEHPPHHSGGDLSPRERVALRVMCSWLSNPEVFWDNEEMDVLDNYKKMAEHAYIAADAFLAQGAPGVDGKETNVVGTRRKEKGRTL